MNDDVERILSNLTPRGAPPDLRGRVLRAVAAELAVNRRAPPLLTRLDVRAALAVAAALFLGVLLNIWIIYTDDASQARLCGNRPLPREIRETVQMAEQAAGLAGAEFVRRQLVAAWQARHRTQPLDLEPYRQQLRQVLFTEERLTDVQEDTEVDGDHPDRNARSAVDCKRHFRLA